MDSVIINIMKLNIFIVIVRLYWKEMTTYAQTTIHSKNSKVEKLKGQSNYMGRIIKGIRLGISNSVDRKKSNFSLLDIMESENIDMRGSEQVIENKKSNNGDSNQQKNSNNKISQQIIKEDPNFLFESNIFPAIYFKKTTMRNLLKQFNFPSKCRALPPNDERAPLIYQIISNLFNQFTFYVFNILVSQHEVTNSFYVFFSDSEIIPYTKCCNAASFVQLQTNGSGRILCNKENCPHPSLAQFLINYEDGRKIWKNLTYLNIAPEKDLAMKGQITKYIRTGKYKKFQLKKIIDETTTQVSEIFNKTKGNINGNGNHADQFADDAFLTKPEVKPLQVLKRLEGLTPEQISQITSGQQKNIQTLKIKIQYMAKRQRSLRKNITRSIVEEGKVFQKKFDFGQKIDDLLRKTHHLNKTPFFSLPRLVEQMKSKQQKRNKSKSVSRNFM